MHLVRAKGSGKSLRVPYAVRFQERPLHDRALQSGPLPALILSCTAGRNSGQNSSGW